METITSCVANMKQLAYFVLTIGSIALCCYLINTAVENINVLKSKLEGTQKVALNFFKTLLVFEKPAYAFAVVAICFVSYQNFPTVQEKDGAKYLNQQLVIDCGKDKNKELSTEPEQKISFISKYSSCFSS